MALESQYIFNNMVGYADTQSAPLPSEGQTVEGSGQFSIQKGFPPECQLPVTQGGVPPTRANMNGILRQITANLAYYAKGGMFNYDATKAYTVPSLVRYTDGKLYLCIQDAPAGVAPTNKSYWNKVLQETDIEPILDKVYPVGAVYISASATDPSELFGGTWERIQGRFLLGADSSHVVNSTGGSSTHTMSVAEMPSHGHSASTNSTGAQTVGTDGAGSHTHTRGSMNITGNFGSVKYGFASGAFSAQANDTRHGSGSNDGWSTVTFNAANNWGGETSSNGWHSHSVSIGNHSHSVTVNNNGSGNAMDIMNPYFAVYMWKRTA